MKNLTFIGREDSVFVYRSKSEMEKYGFQISIVDPCSNFKMSHNIFQNLYSKIIRVIVTYKKIYKIKKKESVVIHELSRDIFWLIPILRVLYNRVVLICYGSDVLRSKKSNKMYMFYLNFLHKIGATNLNVLHELRRRYRIENTKLRLVRFGLPVFDEIDRLMTSKFKPEEFKKKIGLSQELLIVSLGYCATKGQRISDMVCCLGEKHEILSHVQFIVPLQYGDKSVVRDIELKCAQYNEIAKRVIFYCIKDFYDLEMSSKLRICTDILINNSESDSFSGTVQEVLYAGNLVLAADCLPYENMPGYNTSLKLYDGFSKILYFIEKDNYEIWKKNALFEKCKTREELRKISSWEAVIDNWVEFVQ